MKYLLLAGLALCQVHQRANEDLESRVAALVADGTDESVLP